MFCTIVELNELVTFFAQKMFWKEFFWFWHFIFFYMINYQWSPDLVWYNLGSN